MKALQIIAAGQYEIIETEMPQPQDHQVLVEIKLVSTCPRWDMNMMAGKDMFRASVSPDYPLAPGFPGHEMVGVVKEVGRGISRLKPGDRVAALEHIAGNGAYAQYLCYREHELIKLPDNVSDKQAVSFELLKCVLIGLQQFQDLRGKSVLISGLGPAGLLALQAAGLWGASQVIAVDVNEERIAYARSLDIGEVMHVRDLGDRRFALGYDCVGAAASVQQVLDRTDEHVVIFGVLKGDIVYNEKLWLKGTKLESYKYRSFGERDRELLLDLVTNKGLNTECLQTHHFSFTRYHEAVEVLKSQKAIKVCFYPDKDFLAQEEANEG